MDTINKKKLLIYSDCYIYGGSERLLSFIILNPVVKDSYEIHFAYRNHRIYEAGLKDDYGLKRENFHPLLILSNETLFYKIDLLSISDLLKKILKIPFLCLQKAGLYLIFNFLVMFCLLKKIDPQVVHINNGGYPAAKSCLAFVIASKAAKIKDVFYQVNNIAFKAKNTLAVWVDRNLINNNVKCFITASKTAQEALNQNRYFPLDKIMLLPNTTVVKPIVKTRAEILEEFSCPKNSFLLCEVAFLSKRKGQIFLLEALNKIRLIDPILFGKIKLFFVGDGEYEKILKDFSRDNNLESQVIFTGFRNDRLDLIDASDIFVLPSIANEDMPITIFEAMSMGKNIIASNFAGIKEQIENGISGILVEPEQTTLASDLSVAIIKIYNSQSTLTYGQNAQQRFNSYFSMEHYGKRLIKIYNL